MKKAIYLALAALSLNLSIAYADDQTTNFNPAQQQELQTMIHDYLLAHPEIIVQSIQNLQNKQAQAQQDQAKQAFANNIQQILAAPGSPVIGNPKGKVTMVVFLDYQCPYCKRMTSTINQLVQSNPNLRVVFKEFPIFGESSNYAAKAALAANLQGKYHQMHDALMDASASENAPLTTTQVLQVAKSVGLDVAKLQKDMASNIVNEEITNNLNLANNIGFGGTPAFIISNATFGANNAVTAGNKTFFIPGAASLQTLTTLINQAQNPQA